jgi:pyruvate formate-lyase/glycerol dehydratase family glycyl radical enzyme
MKEKKMEEIMRKVSRPKVNERVARLKEKMLQMPEICIERGYLLTESYRETENEPPVIRRAKGLAKVLNGMTLGIDDGELIVGRTTSKPRGGLLIPEVQWKWYLDEMDLFSTRQWDRTAPLADEEKVKMKEFLPYWKNQSLYEKWQAIIPESVRKIHEAGIYISNTGVVSGVHLSHASVDYEKVLNFGLSGVKEQVDEKIGKLNLSHMRDFEKYQFLRAVNITLEAAIAFAGRYAQLARVLAQKETNEKRKTELEKIAGTCERVPKNPARSFHEALQSLWLTYIVLRIEGLGPGMALGRPDQYLYPFYEKDIKGGRITREEALELVELLLIKINDAVVLMSSVFAEQLAGFPTLANITLGGITPGGKDAVNDLSYLFLDAEKDTGMTIDEIVIRVNKKNPDAFLIKACEVNKALTGKFKFLSDDTAIQQMMVDRKPNARDYVTVGCYTPTVPVHSFSTSCAMVNIPFMLELALNNGVSRLTGEQLGPETGDPRKFESYDDVWKAYKKTVEAIMPIGVTSTNIDKQLYADFSPYPFQSSLHGLLLEKGVDITNGGMAPAASQSHGLVGSPNVGDSLAAIKKVVFDDKKITMTELIDALDRNFEDREEIQNMLSSAPKFGNGIEYVDSIVNDVVTQFSDELSKYKGIGGTKHVTAAAAGTSHLGLGSLVGALPDGRRSCKPLSEGGISPHQGRNVSGVTATLRSVASLNHLKLTGGSVLNVKVNPSEVKDEGKIKKFASLIRTYCETGGYLVQFNIISGDILRDAQKHPENYRDLLVRVATYSAYFVELSRTLQDDIIARTEFQNL